MASPIAARQPLAHRPINTTSFYPPSSIAHNATTTTTGAAIPGTAEASSSSSSSASMPHAIPSSSTTAVSRVILKPAAIAGQKRDHSQITTTGQENISVLQQQILQNATSSIATFKEPALPCPTTNRPHQKLGMRTTNSSSVTTNTIPRQKRPRGPFTTTVTVSGVLPPQSQFKQPASNKPVMNNSVACAVAGQRQETHDSVVRRHQQSQQQRQTDAEAEELEQWRHSMKRIISVSTFYFDGIEQNFKDQASRWLTRHGGKVEQFFSNSVNVIVSSREIPPQSRPSGTTQQQQDPPTHDSKSVVKSRVVDPVPSITRTDGVSKNLHLAGSRNQVIEGSTAQPANDIFVRARDLGIRIWSLDKFKRVLRGLTAPTSAKVTPTPSPQTNNLSAALQAEKRHGRTTEQDPSVPREEYVYFQGPYVLVTDIANVHKPIMVREFPAASGRDEALWPMFWVSREGSCPFIRPSQSKTAAAAPRPVEKQHEKQKEVQRGEQKHYARPNNNVVKPLRENKQVTNREVPASGIINSSTAFSAIRSTTTCGSKSNTVTSALSGMGGAVNIAGALSRPLRDMKTRLTTVTKPPLPAVGEQSAAMDPPVAKKRKTEVTLREQLQAKNRKKEKKEGYCENCKERFDDYDAHVLSRRHVKYARNDKNFVELDKLLNLLKRPILETKE